MKRLPIQKGSFFQYINAAKTVVNGPRQSGDLTSIFNLAFGKGNLQASDMDGDMVFFDDSDASEDICEEIFDARFKCVPDVLKLDYKGFIHRDSIRRVILISKDDTDYVVVEGHAKRAICFFASDWYQNLDALRQDLSHFQAGEIDSIKWENYALPDPLEEAQVVEKKKRTISN